MADTQPTVPTGTRTLEDCYRNLATWLIEPAQQTRLKNREVSQGPVIPTADSQIWYDPDMYDTIQSTFHQGVNAATDSSSQAPMIPDSFPDAARPLLWDYYKQGYNVARREDGE